MVARAPRRSSAARRRRTRRHACAARRARRARSRAPAAVRANTASSASPTVAPAASTGPSGTSSRSHVVKCTCAMPSHSTNITTCGALMPPSAASIAFSAASALAPSGPPACAMSGRPPPPLPPSASERLGTRSTAENRAIEIGGDADHDAGLAVLAGRDQGDDAGAELLLALVGEALQILDVDALDGARQQLDVVDAAHAVGRRRRLPPPPIASFFLRVGQLALELLALVEQRRDARRQLVERRLELRTPPPWRAEPALLSGLARAPCRSAPRCGARRRRRRCRRGP